MFQRTFFSKWLNNHPKTTLLKYKVYLYFIYTIIGLDKNIYYEGSDENVFSLL